MYGLYDIDGILRFVTSDREACLEYAELFELNSTDFCLMNVDREISINLLQSQVENNN